MNDELSSIPLQVFVFQGTDMPVNFIQTTSVIEGVMCDVYKFRGDDSKDLGIITINPGNLTPKQRVLQGIKTIEGFVSGAGKLVLTRSSGSVEVYFVDINDEPKFEIEVYIGDLMQWQASDESSLVVYEICFPLYKDGRFENLE